MIRNHSRKATSNREKETKRQEKKNIRKQECCRGEAGAWSTKTELGTENNDKKKKKRTRDTNPKNIIIVSRETTQRNKAANEAQGARGNVKRVTSTLEHMWPETSQRE